VSAPGVVVHACDFGVARGAAGIAALNWEARVFSAIFGRPLEMCARVVANSCIPDEASHGRLLLDYDVVAYPAYMDSKWGKEMQRRVWDETKLVLAAASPWARDIYDELESKKQR